jgi:hypothetical protein
VNSNNSSNITMTNVSIDAVEYVLRVGENGGTAANGFIHISGCEFICGSTLANEGAIVLRYSTTADITNTSSDILGNVVNLSSNAITLTTDDVYWGMGCDITGFTNEQLDIQNDASVPHLFPTSGETEVTAGVDPTYTIIIPATLDFGTLTKNSGTATVTFDVTASGLVLELGSRVNVTVSGDFTMSDSGADLPYSLYNTTSSETALVDGGQFASFTADGTQNGRAEVNTGVIVNAGEYQDTMVFTITYVD